MLSDRGFKIQEVIDNQTEKYKKSSAIIDYFNESLYDYDMFGLNHNADVRYQNTRAEMLLALDEISECWLAEKNDRDKWIQDNKDKYTNKAERWMQIQWAKNSKGPLSAGFSQSLETRISNFIEKLKGQIALREALIGENELMFLESQVSSGFDAQYKCIFDFNADFFKEHGTNLVKKYY